MSSRQYLKSIGLTVLSAVILLCPMFGASAAPAERGAPEKIRIGCATALSGFMASGTFIQQQWANELWVEDVNAKGGLYVPEYKKRIPIALVLYDDKSDAGETVRLVEKLILEDKVDLVLSPYGTAPAVAAAPVFQKYGYPVIMPTVASLSLQRAIHAMPYVFVSQQQPLEHWGPATIELFTQLGVKRVAVLYVAVQYGIEFAGAVVPSMGAKLDVVIFKSYPPNTMDLSPLLKQVKAANVDALIAYSYPADTFIMTQQAKEVGLNPKVFLGGVAVCFPGYRDKFGAAVVQGVMGNTAWSPKLPFPGAKEYYERHVKRFNSEPTFWNNPLTYAGNQVLEHAVEKVGLDRAAIRNEIATDTFSTIAGPWKFVNNYQTEFVGYIGQWQNGTFEIISPAKTRTAEPIFPKPVWPK